MCGIVGITGHDFEFAALQRAVEVLDHHFVEAMRRVPHEFMIRQGVEKFILRQAMKDRLPRQICQRPKFAYSAPAVRAQWGADQAMDDRLQQYCGKQAVDAAGLFDFSMLHKLMKPKRRSFFTGKSQLRIQRLMLMILSVQMIDHMFVQTFESRLKDATARAQSRWPKMRRLDAVQISAGAGKTP